MTNFNEHALEMSIMELFEEEQYEYIRGDKIHRERTEILLCDDLKQYLYNKYSKDGITASEVDSIILMLKNISGSIYEANKAVYKMISDGFIFNREDRTQKDLFINLIDFDTPENNIFFVIIILAFSSINHFICSTSTQYAVFLSIILPSDNSSSSPFKSPTNRIYFFPLYSYSVKFLE